MDATHKKQYNTQGKDETSIQNFSRKNLKRIDHLLNLRVDAKILLNFILK